MNKLRKVSSNINELRRCTMGLLWVGISHLNRQRKAWQQCEWQPMQPVELVTVESQWPWDATYHGTIQMGRGFGSSLCQSRAASSVRLHCSGLCPVECLKTPRTEVARPPFRNNWAWPRNDTEQLSCHSWVYSSGTSGLGILRVPELDLRLPRVTLPCFRLSHWSQEPGIHF